MKATLVSILLICGLCTACGADHAAKPAAQASPSSTTPSPTPSARLVGRWERLITCQELTSELKRAHLGPLVQYAWSGQTSSTGQSSYSAGSPRPTEAHPCVGAIPRKHSHFFDQLGKFGSLDWLGGQVDDGTYTVTADSLVIGHVTFRFRLADQDTLFLTPVLTKSMVRQARAHPQEFSDAGWAVSVAYAGRPWRRAPCDSWC